MRINEHTALSTVKILLVPYEDHHVPTYHSWMKDEDLQQATASEPLSLQEEYAMQKSWRNDGDKLTFIVCLPNVAGDVILAGDEREEMIGDVNLFLTPDDDDEDDDDDNLDGDTKKNKDDEQRYPAAALIGELEIMISRKDLQGHGYGTAALKAFLGYILANLESILSEYSLSTQTTIQKTITTTINEASQEPSSCVLKYFRVKIGKDNRASIALFERIGMQRTSEEPNYFGEVELRLNPGGEDGWESVRRKFPAPRALRYTSKS